MFLAVFFSAPIRTAVVFVANMVMKLANPQMHFFKAKSVFYI